MRQVNKLSEQMNILKALKVSHVIHSNYNMTGEGGGGWQGRKFLRLISSINSHLFTVYSVQLTVWHVNVNAN